MVVRRRGRRRRRWRPARAIAIGVLGLIAAVAALVLALRWADPPTSSVILQHRIAGWWRGDPAPVVRQQWVPWARIPKVVALAVVAAEDQRFPDHAGFDLVEMRRAWASYQAGGRLRGASTLSQQVAKNLFLWHGQSWLRKGLEVPLTLLIEGLWPKERILEIYLNIAQFGPDTYGVGAASWRYFARPVEALTAREAALLASVLPNPRRYSLASPSAAVQRRAAWIRRQMERLGGVAYLARL